MKDNTKQVQKQIILNIMMCVLVTLMLIMDVFILVQESLWLASGGPIDFVYEIHQINIAFIFILVWGILALLNLGLFSYSISLYQDFFSSTKTKLGTLFIVSGTILSFPFLVQTFTFVNVITIILLAEALVFLINQIRKLRTELMLPKDNYDQKILKTKADKTITDENIEQTEESNMNSILKIYRVNITFIGIALFSVIFFFIPIFLLILKTLRLEEGAEMFIGFVYTMSLFLINPIILLGIFFMTSILLFKKTPVVNKKQINTALAKTINGIFGIGSAISLATLPIFFTNDKPIIISNTIAIILLTIALGINIFQYQKIKKIKNN